MLIPRRARLLPGPCGARSGCQRDARAARPSGQQPLRRGAGTCGRSGEGARRDKSLKGSGQTDGCRPPEPAAPPSATPGLPCALRPAPGRASSREGGREGSALRLMTSRCLMKGLARPAHKPAMRRTTADTTRLRTGFPEHCAEKQRGEVSAGPGACLLEPLQNKGPQPFRWATAREALKLTAGSWVPPVPTAAQTPCRLGKHQHGTGLPPLITIPRSSASSR